MSGCLGTQMSRCPDVVMSAPPVFSGPCMVKKSGNSDITFVASVFTGALATFGLTTGNKNNGNNKPINCPMAKKKEE